MSSPLNEICCACVPTEALSLLASLRCEPGLRASVTERRTWLRWDAGNERVLQAVLPIHGVELFRLHAGRWHRFGRTLPAFDFPGDLDYQPLAHVLFPAPVLPIAAPTASWRPLHLALQRDDRPRAATAMLCPLRALAAWSDTVPTARLASLQGVGLGDSVLILGEHLPFVPAAERYWGKDVLILLGHAPALALSESALIEAAGLQEDEILLWRIDGVEAIDKSLLAPLSRPGLRQTAREVRA